MCVVSGMGSASMLFHRPQILSAGTNQLYPEGRKPLPYLTLGMVGKMGEAVPPSFLHND